MLTFIGPNNGGIRTYEDGTFRNRHLSGSEEDTQTVSDGRVVIGRKYVYRTGDYAHVEVDELIFFNEALTDDEVRDLYNMYQ